MSPCPGDLSCGQPALRSPCHYWKHDGPAVAGHSSFRPWTKSEAAHPRTIFCYIPNGVNIIEWVPKTSGGKLPTILHAGSLQRPPRRIHRLVGPGPSAFAGGTRQARTPGSPRRTSGQSPARITPTRSPQTRSSPKFTASRLASPHCKSRTCPAPGARGTRTRSRSTGTEHRCRPKTRLNDF